MTAEKIARALRLRRVGAGNWRGKCPACGYRAGFTVTERRGGLPLFYCHAGRCEQTDLIEALRRSGLWSERHGPETRSTTRRRDVFSTPIVTRIGADAPSAAHGAKREQALAIWRRSRPAEGTLVEIYLRARHYAGPVPLTLREAACKHPSDRLFHPALIAIVEHERHGAVAVHRTFLSRDGHAKGDLDPDKMTLGPCKGAAVRLAPAGPIVAVAEDIESALGYMQSTGTPTWAALSAGGIRTLVLPETVREVVIAADPDPVGIMAAHAAARRWLREDRRVSIARPPLGCDFNDLARVS